jgi:hypothetical protein
VWHRQNIGVPSVVAERGTAEFYQEQVTPIMLFADKLTDPAARRELIAMAAAFQQLADRAASGRPDYLQDPSEKRSA